MVVVSRDGLHVAGVFTDKGLFATSLPRRSRAEAIEAVSGSGLPVVSDPEKVSVLEMVIDIYLGRPVDTSHVRLDMTGLTPRQRQVLEAARRIPRGAVVTYGKLAEMAGLPRAARFVGNVMASNRFAPIVPCHRVISSNGLGGYGLGLELKAALLRREGAPLEGVIRQS